MATHCARLQVFRGLLKEFHLAKQVNSPAYKYLIEQYKSNQTTSAKYCRDPKAASYDASTYHCLLNSMRSYDELINKYNAGEDSIRKAAERVGLKLPDLYESAANEPLETNS